MAIKSRSEFLQIWQEVTEREGEVATLLALGYDTEEVCDELGIAEATLRIHLHSLYRKIGLYNRCLLVTQLWAAGLADSSLVKYEG